MKRFAVGLVPIVLVLGLVGCDGGGPPVGPPANPAPGPPPEPPGNAPDMAKKGPAKNAPPTPP